LKIQTFLQKAGVASRRKAGELVKQGVVLLNGQPVQNPWQEMDPERDAIEVRGKRVRCVETRVYYLFHKPAGILSTVSDPFGRDTVLGYVRSRYGIAQAVFPVGRLDKDTRGLMLLTNDGELANRLLHPRYHVQKTYRAVVAGVFSPEEVRVMAAGMEVGEEHFAPAHVLQLTPGPGPEQTTVEVQLFEGKKRQVKRMFSALGHRVLFLERIRMGKCDLSRVPHPGDLIQLQVEEVGILFPTMKGGVQCEEKNVYRAP